MPGAGLGLKNRNSVVIEGGLATSLAWKSGWIKVSTGHKRGDPNNGDVRVLGKASRRRPGAEGQEMESGASRDRRALWAEQKAQRRGHRRGRGAATALQDRPNKAGYYWDRGGKECTGPIKKGLC